jgi:hypothetical protein
VYTTDRTGNDGYNAAGVADPGVDSLADTNYTSTFGGTSAATPLAAGIGLLLLSRNPELTSTDIRNILENTAEKIGGNNGLTAYDANGFNQYYGFGRANADTSIDAVPGASGDYNRNGVVDAADYVLWRKTQGTMTATAYAGADGSGNKSVGSEDYTVWRSHFGQTITPAGPGSGSGSDALNSALATESESPQEFTNSPGADQKMATETTAVASVDVGAGGVHLFQTPVAPAGSAFVSRPAHGGHHSALANVAARNDEGLLAWLSDHSFQRPNDNSDSGDDRNDFLTDDRDHYSDVADNAFEPFRPSIRSTPKSLVAAG